MLILIRWNSVLSGASQFLEAILVFQILMEDIWRIGINNLERLLLKLNLHAFWSFV